MQSRKCCFLFFTALVTTASLALNLKTLELPLQLGFFASNPGEAQYINIQGLVGDQYTITRNRRDNIAIGTGLFIPGTDKDRFKLSYGINAFYLATTAVYGNIIQENLFSNLSYQYHLQHVPLYVAAKGKIDTNSDKYTLMLDAGLGPNFMFISDYKVNALNDFTVAEKIFSSAANQVVFSATAGIGLRLNNLLGQHPLECGYRFFYLGQGELSTTSNQVLNKLSTGQNYANALICSITL